MNDAETAAEPAASIAKLPVGAAIVALIGLVDSVYLTIHHLNAVPVPCSLIDGCDTVLTSSYAEIAGIPLAAFGAAAYFAAFSLALLAAFGNRMMWTLFGGQAILMALVSGWLIYLQAAVIGAFCQFCLLSAATSLTLLALFVISLLAKRK